MTALFVVLVLCNCGFKMGSSYANLTIDGDGAPVSLSDRVGRLKGGFIAIPITPRFDVQYQLLISRKNVSLDNPGGRTDIEIEYLQVPVLFRYGPRLFGTLLKGFAGPSLAVKLNTEATGDLPGALDSEDFGDKVDPLDLGFVIGAAVERYGLTLDARYTWGRGNLYAGPGRDEAKVNNRAFSILFGLRFGIMEPFGRNGTTDRAHVGQRLNR